MLIKKRRFYLQDSGFYKEIHQYNLFFKNEYKASDKKMLIDQFIDLFDLDKIPHFIDSKLKKLFWQHATPEIQKALIFSYQTYIQNHSKKVSNVQTINWLEIPFFNNYLKKRFNRLKLNNFDPIKFLGTKLGKHKLSIRFENIHLALDYINSEPIFTVHWDRGYPHTHPKWIYHYLFDDVLS